MSTIPEELKYTKDHEWLRVEDGEAVVGITDHAQETLGDITFIELPTIGDTVSQGDSFGVVESVKAASDLYLPIGGEILAVNDALEDDPSIVNQDCYGEGWIARIRIETPAELESLLTPADYAGLL